MLVLHGFLWRFSDFCPIYSMSINRNYGNIIGSHRHKYHNKCENSDLPQKTE